ncbi:MAG TPA: MarR family transcriptional regulator [Actinocatenispora sp.]
MPGGRLSYEERRSVGAGLAVGRSCAEIARELGRPRSTVSREVARNGGARGYRANRAQQATEWRARRRPHPAPPDDAGPDPGTAPAGAARDPRALAEFERRFARMMIETGVPAMAARVLAALFGSDGGSHTAAELVGHLAVSPASVSKAVTWLEARGMVRRERDGRRERYVMDDQIWYQTWASSMRSMARWADHTREGARLLGPGTPAGVRLDTATRFFRLLGEDMSRAAEHWRQTLGY